MKRNICIIGCGSRKRTLPCSARDLYQGSLFTMNRRYAEFRFPGSWFIMSAKYGLLAPSDQVVPYDEYFSTAGQATPDYLSMLGDQLNRFALHSCNLVVTASAAYVEVLRRAKGGAELTILEPLRHLSQGLRLQWLKSQLTKS